MIKRYEYPVIGTPKEHIQGVYVLNEDHEGVVVELEEAHALIRNLQELNQEANEYAASDKRLIDAQAELIKIQEELEVNDNKYITTLHWVLGTSIAIHLCVAIYATGRLFL